MNDKIETIKATAMALGGITYYFAASSYLVNHFSGILF